MLALILARQQAGPIRRAGGGGHEGIAEAHALGRQLIDVRRPENRIPVAPQIVRSMIIREDDYDIWARGSSQR